MPKFTALIGGVGAASPAKSLPSFKLTGLPLVMGLIFAQVLLAFSASGLAKADATTDAALNRTWQRTDQPIVAKMVDRTWVWGPQQNKNGFEMYEQSPGGQRQVRYYDKSRMEINNPAGDSNSQWYVTNGLLVKEMITGMLQVGDNSFVPYKGSQETIAGDPASVNANAPTYVSLRPLASLNNDNRAEKKSGQVVKARLYKAGTFDIDSGYNKYNVTNSFYEPVLGHNIPNVFMQFFDRQGPVMENGKIVNGKVFEWIYAAGLPLTEPYWTKTKVGGTEKDVLVQAFERRIITYTPDNAADWKVELGNVGSSYASWRYGTDGKDKADPANNGGVTPVPGGTANPYPGDGNGGSNPGDNGGNPPSGPNPGDGDGGTNPGGGGTNPGGGNGGGNPPAGTSPTVAGDFSLSLGGPADLNAGGTAKINVNVGSLNGFTGPVSLSVEGASPGIHANLSASTVNLEPNGTAGVTLNLSADPGLKPGTVGLTVKANAGNISKSAGVSVNLKTPGSVSISGGGSLQLGKNKVGHASVNLQALGGFSGQCSLSVKASGLGLSASVTPNVTLGVNGSASADVTINSNNIVGAGVVTVIAVCGDKTVSTSINVAVKAL